jgi:hypothetical protein
MDKQGFGTLANLAKILEDASNPESVLREDKRETKQKTSQLDHAHRGKKKVLDPKRKAWYKKRLREQSDSEHVSLPATTPLATIPTQTVARSTAVTVSSDLFNALAAAKEAKPKDGTKRPEAWKRKPGDPFF